MNTPIRYRPEFDTRPHVRHCIVCGKMSYRTYKMIMRKTHIDHICSKLCLQEFRNLREAAKTV